MIIYCKNCGRVHNPENGFCVCESIRTESCERIDDMKEDRRGKGTNMDKDLILIITAILISFNVTVALLWDTPSEADIADMSLQNYCEMVRIHKEDPTLGWPDYRGIYAERCEKKTKD